MYFNILAQIWHFFLAILAKNSKNWVLGHVENRDRVSVSFGTTEGHKNAFFWFFAPNSHQNTRKSRFWALFCSKLKTEPTFREQKFKVCSLNVGSEFDFEQRKGSKFDFIDLAPNSRQNTRKIFWALFSLKTKNRAHFKRMERLKIRFYRFWRQIPVNIPENHVFGPFFFARN